MHSVLITGGNRGIGLGLVKAFAELSNAPRHIIATCRNSSNSEELQQVASCNDKVKILNLETTDFPSLPDFQKSVENIVQEDGLNLLINNAGISEKFYRIGMIKADKLQESFLVNTTAPLMLTKHLLPILKKAADKNKQLPPGCQRAVIVNISSILGSISGNKEGGFYPYKCSKSALNAATKSISVDLKPNGILAVSLHPGWIKTSMGGPNAPLTVEQACPQIIDTIMSFNESHSGGFYDYTGKSIPW